MQAKTQYSTTAECGGREKFANTACFQTHNECVMNLKHLYHCCMGCIAWLHCRCGSEQQHVCFTLHMPALQAATSTAWYTSVRIPDDSSRGLQGFCWMRQVLPWQRRNVLVQRIHVNSWNWINKWMHLNYFIFIFIYLLFFLRLSYLNIYISSAPHSPV